MEWVQHVGVRQMDIIRLCGARQHVSDSDTISGAGAMCRPLSTRPVKMNITHRQNHARRALACLQLIGFPHLASFGLICLASVKYSLQASLGAACKWTLETYKALGVHVSDTVDVILQNKLLKA